MRARWTIYKPVTRKVDVRVYRYIACDQAAESCMVYCASGSRGEIPKSIDPVQCHRRISLRSMLPKCCARAKPSLQQACVTPPIERLPFYRLILRGARVLCRLNCCPVPRETMSTGKTVPQKMLCLDLALNCSTRISDGGFSQIASVKT